MPTQLVPPRQRSESIGVPPTGVDLIIGSNLVLLVNTMTERGEEM